ncbi:MAG: dephospho-CoA kinase [Chloroflexota bacterium]
MAAGTLLGITGGIACGKSTVDALLLDLGAAAVIDADLVVHDLLAHDGAVQEAIAARFGSHLLTSEGVDRRALGAIVFADTGALRALEAITHPAVRDRIAAQVAALPPEAVAVVDAVKLLQGPLAALCTRRWWVQATPRQQVARLVARRGMSEADALRRVAAGPRLEDWRYLVDVVIDNSGSLANTRLQVERAWADLPRSEG